MAAVVVSVVAKAAPTDQDIVETRKYPDRDKTEAFGVRDQDFMYQRKITTEQKQITSNFY